MIRPGDTVYSPHGLAWVHSLDERLIEAGPDEWVAGAWVYPEGADGPEDRPVWVALVECELCVSASEATDDA